MPFNRHEARRNLRKQLTNWNQDARTSIGLRCNLATRPPFDCRTEARLSQAGPDAAAGWLAEQRTCPGLISTNLHISRRDLLAFG
jgi:hypothetical protein